MEEMTPRPEIIITDEVESLEVVEERRKRLKDLVFHTSYYFDSIFESWRKAHLVQIGCVSDYATYEDYLMAKVDPDPYDDTYIFYCLEK